MEFDDESKPVSASAAQEVVLIQAETAPGTNGIVAARGLVLSQEVPVVALAPPRTGGRYSFNPETGEYTELQ